MLDIPDRRHDDPAKYETKDRRGSMKRSWQRGLERQHDERQTISFEGGLTWGSIGQIMGYLLGEVDESFQDELYERMLEQYERTDRGQKLTT